MFIVMLGGTVVTIVRGETVGQQIRRAPPEGRILRRVDKVTVLARRGGIFIYPDDGPIQPGCARKLS